MRVGPCHFICFVCHWLFSYDQWQFPQMKLPISKFHVIFFLNKIKLKMVNWMWKIKIKIISICDVQEVIKVGIKMVQTAIIQIHHITIKVILATKAAVVALAATGATMIALDVIISKASVVAQWDQIITINAAIHMETIAVLQITMASVSTSHFDCGRNSFVQTKKNTNKTKIKIRKGNKTKRMCLFGKSGNNQNQNGGGYNQGYNSGPMGGGNFGGGNRRY